MNANIKHKTGLLFVALGLLLATAWAHGVWIFIHSSQESEDFQVLKTRFEELIPVAQYSFFPFLLALMPIVAFLISLWLLAHTKSSTARIGYGSIMLFAVLIGIVSIWQIL